MIKRKRALLVSLDALSSTEFTLIQKLPGFSRLLRTGAYCPEERSVYPSLTFPCHASIATGCNPGTHGIVNNYILDPFAPIERWNFYSSNLKRRALWDYAAQVGKTVMSISWPVSAGANIRWSMPEMTPAKPKIWTISSFFEQMAVLRKYGNGGFSARNLLSRPGLVKAWFLGQQPALDEGMTKTFLRAIHTYDFDIAVLHIYGMDDAKHKYGADSTEAHSFLGKYDSFITNLLDFVDAQDAVGNDATLIVTGDHSQKNVHSAIYGNELLHRMGLFPDWKDGPGPYSAYMDSCDGMAYVYIPNSPKKEEFLQRIRECFTNHLGVKSVMEREQFIPLGCDPNASLVLEAQDGYGFESTPPEPGKQPDENGIAPSHYKALHGYLPEQPNYYTMCMAYGPSVLHKRIPKMCITDILPTLCNWMHIPIDPVDGKIILGVFADC